MSSELSSKILPYLSPLEWVDYEQFGSVIISRVESNQIGAYVVRMDKQIKADGVAILYRWNFRAHSGHDTESTPRNGGGHCESFEDGKHRRDQHYKQRVMLLFMKVDHQ